ncbi:MAG: hypothetical protein DRP66_06310 [Planctomycetota bacterium]|nr:MAG: hypothetical protein DRP66_06310 [Planctomycetota bacterium]
MHYKIKGTEIRSENAAKPATDAAASLVRWVCDRDSTPSALDYGCGKLRYTGHLAQRSKHIGLVDSEVQLTRTQRIHGEYTSIKAYAKKIWPSCTIQNLKDFWKQSAHRYHFVLCANVLSAIPCPKTRARSLRAIRAALAHNGRVLFVNQHTNSYFTEVRKRASSRPHLDGWIAESKGGSSYYGILTVLCNFIKVI